jgi:hypothetical protein
MSTEAERAKEIDDAVKAADARKRADAEEEASAGEKLDKLLEALDSISKRMDSYDEEAERAAKGAGAREHQEADSDDDDDEREKGEPKKLGADSRRADGIRADSEEVEHFRKEIGSQYAAVDSVLADIQARADRASSAWGKSAPPPMDGERIGPYRRRVARQHQQHSANWRDVDLGQLHGQSLRVAADQIFADSFDASRAPESYGDCLREVVRRGPLGHIIKEYYGSPSAWMDQFRGGPRRYARFDMALIKKSMS